MPRTHRLSRADFALTRGFRRLGGQFFSYSYGQLPGRSMPAAACVVSKKIAPRAVDRNTIRRRARSALIRELTRVTFPLCVICTARKLALGASSQEVAEEIASTIAKIVRR